MGIRIEKEFYDSSLLCTSIVYLKFGIRIIIIFSTKGHASSSAYDVELFCQDINIVLQKVQAITSNIANVNTTITVEGGPYKRKILVNCKKGSCEEIRDQSPLILKYDPQHPDADKNGYVAYPNININREMLDMIRAQRAYELIVSNRPAVIESADLLVGDNMHECFEKYQYFQEHFDFQEYFERR